MAVTQKAQTLIRWLVLGAIVTSCASVVLLTMQSSNAHATTPLMTPPAPMHKLSSGTFALPTGAVSVDWVVLNDAPTPQKVRVTVYNVLIGMAKTVVPPGPITTVVAPNTATHNANSVGSVFQLGGMYEVVVETADLRVLPSVDVWSANTAIVIPGTHLSPRDFSEIR